MDDAPHAHNLKSLFETALERYADRVAVRFGSAELTYGELDERANAVAHALRERRVGSEDRVGLMMSNCLEYVIADLAIVKAGAVKVPLNDMLTADEFEFMLSDSGARTVICGGNFVETLVEIRSSLDELDHCIAVRRGDELPHDVEAFEELDGRRDEPPAGTPAPDDVGGHYYTGGTTGQPKGAVHTHQGIAMNMYAHIVELGITGDDTLLLMTPLPHSAGAFLWAALLTGATSVIHAGFEPSRALESIQTHSISWTFMVPTMIYRVLDHPDLTQCETDSLETLAYGAAPMTPARLREGLDEFGPVFLQFYGQTEMPNVITTFGKAEHRLAIAKGHEDRLSSAGQPSLMAAVRVVDPETGDELPQGEEGELVAKAPYSMREYFERPEKTTETLRDGWLRTGDIGRIDDDGFVYLLDRASDMIITGGMNVYSTEVEGVLDEHPAVKEVAVIGRPDEEWGEIVTAVVVSHDEASATENDLIEFAAERLSDYKKPKLVEFVDDIPKTPYGKMDKKQLRDRHWQEQNRQIS